MPKVTLLNQQCLYTVRHSPSPCILLVELTTIQLSRLILLHTSLSRTLYASLKSYSAALYFVLALFSQVCRHIRPNRTQSKLLLVNQSLIIMVVLHTYMYIELLYVKKATRHIGDTTWTSYWIHNQSQDMYIHVGTWTSLGNARDAENDKPKSNNST